MAKKDFTNEEVLLSVQHLCQYFKRKGGGYTKAVDDVSFDVHKGEVFGLVGESGCGKTTTGRSIIKIYDITGGSIYFKGYRIGAGIAKYKEEIKDLKKQLKKDGADATAINARIAELNEEIKKAKADLKEVDSKYREQHLKELTEEYEEKMKDSSLSEEEKANIKKKYESESSVAKHKRLVTDIQMIFQDPIASLNPRMTVREIIAEGMIIQGIKDKEYIDEKVYEVLEKVGLVREHADRYPHEFSGGQRQRIGIARSVVMQPDMLIADEPVSALDVSVQAQVINLLNELREELGLTILFIAHDLSVVKYFSDRIGVMYYGKMVELADSDELFAHPMHPYTRSLLSAVPLPDPHYEKKRVRITYNPLADHDYSQQQPSLREVFPDHYVLCNDEEEAKYKEEYEGK